MLNKQIFWHIPNCHTEKARNCTTQTYPKIHTSKSSQKLGQTKVDSYSKKLLKLLLTLIDYIHIF